MLLLRDDWYRNKQWNPSIEKSFFEKLDRARSQRNQYLAIQALTLAETRPEVTLKLVDLYFETRKNCFDDSRVFDAKAKAHLALSNIPKAISAFKEAIDVVDSCDGKGFATVAYGELPLLIAKNNIKQEYEYALSLLNSKSGDDIFPIAGFMRHAAYALILGELGESKLATTHARQAQEYAELRDSGLQYHQKLGLVGNRFKDIRAKLATLAKN